jgi:HEAT repeat protein
MDLHTLSETPPWDWPKDAGKTFGRFLKNRDVRPADRLTAADLASNLTVLDDELANVLMTVLRDNSEPAELRAQAAISFGPVLELASDEWFEEFDGFQDPDSVPIGKVTFRKILDAMEQTYRDTAAPKLVRRKALEGSIRAPQPWLEDAIREAYATGDAEWMLTAVFAMQYVPDFEAEVLEALRSADPEVHYQAVVAAGEKELDAAWPHIFKLAKDGRTEKNLRMAAIEAIGCIRPEESAELLKHLSASADEDIAAAAAEALSFDEFEDDEEEVEEDDDEEEE